MMFTWLNKQGVKSDRGFAVQMLDRFTAEYREGNNSIRVDVQIGLQGSKPCLSIAPTAFTRWDGDPCDEALPIAKQQEILRNFCEAMDFQGVSVVSE